MKKSSGLRSLRLLFVNSFRQIVLTFFILAAMLGCVILFPEEAATQSQNNPPNAVNDSYSGIAARFQPASTGLLLNDSDPDGNAITVGGSIYSSNPRVVSGPSNGSVSFPAGNGNGNGDNGGFYYSPNWGYTGSDSFVYNCCDNFGACSTATVSLNQANSAPNASGESYTGLAARQQLAPGLLANDSDPDGDSLTLGFSSNTNPNYYVPPIASPPANGSLALPYNDGRFQYSPSNGYVGIDSFTYNVCDSFGACTQATATVQANDRPIGGADEYEIFQGSGIIFTAENVLTANDSDPNGDGRQVGFYSPYQPNNIVQPLASQASNGYVYIHETAYGMFSYSPNAGFTGYDNFYYNLCDDLGACSPTRVDLYIFPTDGKDEDLGDVFCQTKVAKPVNVTNGNMFLQQTDYQLSGVGEAIDATRTYNSQQQTSGLFGIGWSTLYDESLIQYGGNTLRLQTADGKAVYFGRNNPTSPFVAQSGGFYGQIVKNADGSFDLTFKDGRIHSFNSLGRLTLLKDRNNNQTILNYDGFNRLVSIVDSFGRNLTVTTDTAGKITALSDTIGAVATYAYGANGQLDTVIYADGSKYIFTYITQNNRLLLTEVKDALNNILEKHQYDYLDRATTSEVDGGAEKYTIAYTNANLTTVTDGLGRVSRYTLGQLGTKFLVTQVEGVCGCGGAGNQVQTWTYDRKLNITKKVDALGREMLYNYDSNGNRLSMTDVLGTETYSYNAFGEILTRTDRMNGTTTNTYNATGNLLTSKDALNFTTTLTYDARGQILTIKDALNNITTLTYDGFGRLTQIKDANNKQTNFAYDARVRLTSATNALNFTTSFEYDLNNRLKKITHPDLTFMSYTYDLAGRRTQMTDERGNAMNYGYDNAYRLISMTDALNHTTTYGYDLMSHLVSQTDALMNTTNYEYDDFNRLKKAIYPPSVVNATRLEERLEYDTVGNVRKRIDTANRETLFDYDTANRLIKITDALNQMTQFEYNPRSQMTKVKDALNQDYVFTYDALGRQLSQTRAATTMSYEYDAVGNRTKRTDYIGRETSYEYDVLNRLKKINYLQSYNGNPPLTPIQTANYNYDDLSRLTSATNDAGTVSFTYDNRNRIKTTTDVFNHLIEYNYDANGNRTQLKLDGTVHTIYAYDVANRLTSLIDEAIQNFTFGYDIANRLISKTLPNAITTTYNYDGMSRLTRLKHQSSTATLTDNQFAYNPANQINQIAELTQTKNFGYDTIDRLTSMNNGTANENYAFDLVGNRTSSQRSDAYGYQPFNKLTSTQTATYSYNANGNMLSKADATGFWVYSWDYENRMTTARKQFKVVRYQYDALGRRVSRLGKSVGATAKYTYDGLDVILDDGSDGIVKYQNGLGIDDKLKMVTNGSAKYFLQDHLGSTVGLADSSGAVVSSASYDSFGNSTNNLTTRYQYTGREFDSYTGLYYYRARWYDANLGRFISEDPIGFTGGDVNLYGYVWNSPNKFSDPTGLDGWGNDTADALDEDIDFARGYWQYNDQEWFANGVNDTIADLAHGTVDALRIGSGTYNAIYADDNGYGRAANIALDIQRATVIFSILAGPFVRAGVSSRPTILESCKTNYDYLRRGGEYPAKGDFRVAPFGNRTNPPHPIGKYPHYHRQGPKYLKGKKKGQPLEGQGKGRHRPWESSPFDKSFWDRF